jgi:hypothetical protein
MKQRFFDFFCFPAFILLHRFNFRATSLIPPHFPTVIMANEDVEDNFLYPFSAYAVDLRGLELSAEQKMWMGRQINSGLTSPRLLASRFQLKGRMISQWARRMKSGSILKNGRGRPRAFDLRSMNSIDVFVASELSSDRSAFTMILGDEYYETSERRATLIGIEWIGAKEIPRTTVNKYISLYKPEIMNAKNSDLFG